MKKELMPMRNGGNPPPNTEPEIAEAFLEAIDYLEQKE